MSTKNIQKQWLWAGLVIGICVLLSAWIVFKDSSGTIDSPNILKIINLYVSNIKLLGR